MLTKEERLRFQEQAKYCLISYPKCGRTWLRVMLGRLFQQRFAPEQENLLELDEMALRHPEIPSIWVSHDDKPQWKRASEIETDKGHYRDRRVIFLVRDPRDVLISNYFQKSKRRHRYEGTLSNFLTEEVGSLDCILRFFNIWIKNRDEPEEFLLLRYEDIHDDPERELSRVLSFLELRDLPSEQLREAVSYSTFDRMHRMERDDVFGSKRLRPVNPEDPESYKTRRGKVGGYRDYLDASEIESIDQRIKKELSRDLGYCYDVA